MGNRGNTLVVIVAAITIGLAAGCSGSTATDSAGGTTATTTPPEPYAGFTSEQYTGDANWLCRPGKVGQVCDENLDATVIAADGTLTVKPFTKAAAPAIDCFYVYPTISSDQGTNSDLNAGDEERSAVESQAARFGEHCRVFAPVYRQIPLAALTGALSGQPADSTSTSTTPAGTVSPRELAYGDVLAAWKQYMAHDNQGRGVVLLGHSQGTGDLVRLMREEIDPDPVLRSRLVSAVLLGGTVAVPQGADVGGDFANIPLCRTEDQFGCAVTYMSFRATAPPPEDSFFGKPRTGDGEAGCTNPAAITGGPGPADAYFRNDRSWLRNEEAATPITTRWVELPDLITTECKQQNGFTYLEATIQTDPTSPRVDTIPGDLTPQWGLHVVDYSLTMGNLVDLVGKQAAAYEAAR